MVENGFLLDLKNLSLELHEKTTPVWVRGFANLLDQAGVSFRRNVKVTGSAFLPMQTSRLCWNRS